MYWFDMISNLVVYDKNTVVFISYLDIRVKLCQHVVIGICGPQQAPSSSAAEGLLIRKCGEATMATTPRDLWTREAPRVSEDQLRVLGLGKATSC